MANRVKRRAKEEAMLTFENKIRQKLKSSKNHSRRISFTSLQRQVLLEANFKIQESGLQDLIPEQKSILLFCRRFLNARNLDTYFPVYPSPKELLADFLQNIFLLYLFTEENRGLIEFMYRAKIVRPFATWKPKYRRNSKRLLWSFIAHAYIRYPHQIPFFLQRLYHNYCSYQIKLQTSYWLLGFRMVFHLAEGKGWHNMDDFHAFPIPTKANFYIQKSPKKYRGNYLSALYWACLRCYLPKEVIDLFWSTFINIGEYYLKNGIAIFKFIGQQSDLSRRDWIRLFYTSNQLMRFFQINSPMGFDDYYHSVIRFFLKEYQAIGMSEITVWLEYIKEKKELNQALKMKGRSVTAFRRKMDQHLEASYVAKHNSNWKGMDKKDYYLDQENQSFRITQLKTDFDLYAEGQLMSHCVYSYVDECNSGTSAIWSLQEQVEIGHWKPLTTIEVQGGHKIWQTLARFNNAPSTEMMKIIKAWANLEKLDLS